MTAKLVESTDLDQYEKAITEKSYRLKDQACKRAKENV